MKRKQAIYTYVHTYCMYVHVLAIYDIFKCICILKYFQRLIFKYIPPFLMHLCI